MHNIRFPSTLDLNWRRLSYDVLQALDPSATSLRRGSETSAFAPKSDFDVFPQLLVVSQEREICVQIQIQQPNPTITLHNVRQI